MAIKELKEGNVIQNEPKRSHLFQKGNKAAVGAGGGGRPKERNAKLYLDIVREELTPELWRGIIRTAIADAICDDGMIRAKARDFFSKHILPNKVELEISGEIPIKIIAVENFKGWGDNPVSDTVSTD